MMTIFSLIINIVHLLSASIWIGGCFLLIIFSGSKTFKLHKESTSIFHTLSGLFRESVNASMILIFLSGIIMTIQKLSLVQTSLSYAVILGFKILISIWVSYRIWKFRKTNYPKYSNQIKEWLLGYNSFIVYGVLIFLLAGSLESITLN